MQIIFTGLDQEQTDLLVAMLAESGYEGFEEKEDSLVACIPFKDYDKNRLNELAEKINLHYKEQIIEPTNWNLLWESAFDPVIIPGFAVIRASFHDPVDNLPHDILINPKMSFGTGHHATTRLVMAEMANLDIKDRQVLDFGTGTGILAILAEKMGAAGITAIDHDQWSIENANENLRINHCRKIKLLEKSDPELSARFDIILANINRNTILENLHLLKKQAHSDSIIILSGLLEEDMKDIVSALDIQRLNIKNTTREQGWICLKLGIS